MSHPPRLQWEFDWDSILRLEERVKEYEAALTEAITQKRQSAPASSGGIEPSSGIATRYGLEFFGKNENQIAESVLVSMTKLSQPLKPSAPDDGLTTILRERLYGAISSPAADNDFSPHWSLLPLLSFGPIVTTQARLVNRECVKLLFESHNLRVHLDMQKQYHLLGNGLFCSRLSHALFDPELDTAERQAGIALTGGRMGLRLMDAKAGRLPAPNFAWLS